MWLSGNPYQCDCSMTWMAGWLNTFTTPLGQHIIVDFKELICETGMAKGMPIYQLNEIDMGCFPSKWTTAQKIAVGIGTGIAVIIIIVLLIVTKRSRELKFLLYYHLKLNTIPDDDKNENVENMKYDAFFCFW